MALLVVNCSDSDDSNGNDRPPSGEISVAFDTANPELLKQFFSESNSFELPCEFAQIDIFTQVSGDNSTLEVLDINIPADAFFSGDDFDFTDSFPDGFGNDLISSVSLRVDGNNWVAISGTISNLNYRLSDDEDGFPTISFTAVLNMSFAGSSGREGDLIQVRIQVTNVGQGDESTC